MNPAGVISSAFQFESRYHDVTYFPPEFQKWRDVLHTFTAEGQYGPAQVVVCRNWTLGCSIAVYDSRNIVPDNLDFAWRICFRSGVYKVIKTKAPHNERTCLTVFPHIGSEIVAESRQGVRTIIKMED